MRGKLDISKQGLKEAVNYWYFMKIDKKISLRSYEKWVRGILLNYHPLFSVYDDYLCLSFESVCYTNKIPSWKTSIEVKNRFYKSLQGSPTFSVKCAESWGFDCLIVYLNSTNLKTCLFSKDST